MEKKTLSTEEIKLLRKPLPNEAVKQHPTKTFLSTIKAIYVVERLNDVFGIGQWYQTSEVVKDDGKMIVVKSFLKVPEYGIELEAFGGNDNADLGDAYKGAVTDALTKMGSYLEIGINVFKGLHGKVQPEDEIEEYDEVGEQNRAYLQSLLETSAFDDETKRKMSVRIQQIIDMVSFEKAKVNLVGNQIEDKDRIHMGMNYNQGDIKKNAKARA